MKDPIILYPPTSPAEVWDDCKKWVEGHGGMKYPDGQPNLMAAAGADPGCCKCPSCHEFHWAYGIIHKCPSCGFVYPTDWWPMLSYGSAAGRLESSGNMSETEKRWQEKNVQRSKHPYWAYGFKHKLQNPWEEKEQIDWKTEIGDCYIAGGELRPPVDYFELCNPKNQ